MNTHARHPRLSRRKFVKIGAVAVGASVLPSVTTTSAQPRAVPRNRTLTLVWSGSREGRWIDYELWNPYAIGSNHQNGPGIFYEPLAYYSAFADKEYLWLAESYKYSPDFKELTIKTRSGIKWSDGTPFGADDVTYTLNALKELGPKVRWGVDVQQFMQEARTSAPNTVVIKFKVPAPRFFYFMTYKYDIGVYIVPKHIFQGQDWTTFKHYDPSKDWPVTSVDARPHAASLGAPCDSGFPSRLDSDVRLRVPDPVAPDVRRLQSRRFPGSDAHLRWRHDRPRNPAGAFHRAGRDGRLGARHAGHDGHDTGGRLRPLRGSERASPLHDLSVVLRPERDPASDHRAGAGARQHPLGGWSRSSSAIPVWERFSFTPFGRTITSSSRESCSRSLWRLGSPL